MSEIKLNLARKWRSKQFEEIVGQDLSVRMLKNSLFLQQFFPVYLFSGQRGCGKTTTARVFAAALNCQNFDAFRKQPQKQALPCQSCPSCHAMETGKHPDFIEIDAASHTGVDHVRMLIDSASLLPLMGSKKMYLIDEAHMLSKAAFNALLKILEEPPSSVIFMLATTDPHKIIETVRSRCFQLFFRPVETDILFNQLKMICENEHIKYDEAGLQEIVKQTEGSVRDALNMLETVRFSHKKVTVDAVAQMLGRIDDKALLLLFKAALSGDAVTILESIKKLEWKQYAAPLVWDRLLELARAALWVKYGVEPDHFLEHHEQLKAIVKDCSLHQLTRFMRNMYDRELLFSKTTAKHDVIEMVLLSLCEPTKKSGNDGGNTSSAQTAPVAYPSDQEYEQGDESDEEEDSEDDEHEGWKGFLRAIAASHEPLINSVFQQGTVLQYDATSQTLHVEFSKDLQFFSEWLDSTQNIWLPLLKKQFGNNITLQPSFTGQTTVRMSAKERVATYKDTAHESSYNQQQKKKAASSKQSSFSEKKTRTYSKRSTRSQTKLFAHEVAIDTSDSKEWPIAHLVKQHIPGTITEIRE